MRRGTQGTHIACGRGASNDKIGEDIAVRKPLRASLPSALESLSIEHCVEFSDGRVEVRNYTWSQPVEEVWALSANVCVVNMALSPRPVPCRIAHLSLGSHSAPQDVGRILVIPPGSTIRLSASTGRHRAVHCALYRSKIEEVLECDPDWSERWSQRTMCPGGRQLEWLLFNIYRELRQERFGFELMVESLANALCVELVRRFQPSGVEDLRPLKRRLAPWRMRILRERIEADAPAPDLPELAELCCMTVRQLCRAFKQETGQTIGKFVESAVIDRARMLLSESGLSVGEIARKLGFATSASFAYAFHRNTGLKPSEVEGPRRERPRRNIRR